MDRSLQLWDAATGRTIRSLFTHEHSVMTASFSSDGKSILTGSMDYTAGLWDTASGRERRRFVGHKEWVTAAALSRDGRRLLTGSHDRTARLWDAETGEELKKFEGFGHYVKAVAFSRSGELCAAGSLDKTVRIYRTATGEPLGEPLRVSSGISALMFLPEGDLLVTAEETNSTARLWDVRTGKELRVFAGEHKARNPDLSFNAIILALSFLPETQTLVTASAERVVFWRLADTQPLRRLELPQNDITAVAVSADGRQVLTGANDGTTVLRAVEGGGELQRFGGDALRVNRVSASADGRLVLISGSAHAAVLWDTEQGREVRRFKQGEGGVSSSRLSPDGGWVFTSDDEGVGRTWNTADGRELQRYVGHRNDITSVAFSADGERILTGGNDGTARLWNRRTGEQLKKFGTSKGIINAVAFSPDEKHVLTGGDNSPVRLWSVESERQEAQFDGPDPRLSVEAVTFIHGGKAIVVAGGVDTAIRIWNVKTRAVEKTLAGHTERVASLTVSRDGRRILSGSWDGTVRLWDVQSGTHRRFGPHAGWGAEAVFFRGERYIVAATADGMTRIWDTEAAESQGEFCSLISFEGGAWVVADPEGRFDTNDIEQARQLGWVMPDDVMTGLPVEIFMRQYFEPRLLSRLLDHDEFGEVPELAGLNRVQPLVQIADARRAEDGTAVVTVEVEVARRQFERDGRSQLVESGAKDLRLFRDGRLVGYSDGNLFGAGPPRAGVRCELIAGRRDACRAIFEGITLPRGVPPPAVEFYAYAFNSSDVKSETRRRSLRPGAAMRAGGRRAYVVSVGVSGYENPDWNLRFAADDARLFAERVGARLRATNAFEQVVEVRLTADAGERPAADPRSLATKDNFRGVLATLAAGGDDRGFPGLRKAAPDDVVIVFYSSHGFRDLETFYLFPYDIGAGRGRDPAAVLPQTITDSDLYLWLRDVDAGEMVLVIDACHAGASLAPGSRLKPGPMGSSGMGQLAYDKGMRVLAATQAETTAQEADLNSRLLRIHNGLLTHALVVDGLSGNLADVDGDGTVLLSEWLGYGSQAVPALHARALQSRTEEEGVAGAAGRSNAPVAVQGGAREAASLQYPALFDFTEKLRGQRPLVIQRGGP
jgi:WD40 repeat protein